MENFQLQEWLAGEDTFFTHLGIFTSLILGGVGVPIPEDLPLLAGGIAASKNIVSLKSIFITCYIGVIISDQIIFLIGYYFGNRLIEAGKGSKFFPTIDDKKLAKIRSGLREKRFLYIFLGRHLFPLRSATFLSAGALRIPYHEFFIADVLAALISVTLMLGIGYWLGETISPELWTEILKRIHIVLTAILGLIVLLYYLKRRSKNSQES